MEGVKSFRLGSRCCRQTCPLLTSPWGRQWKSTISGAAVVYLTLTIDFLVNWARKDTARRIRETAEKWQHWYFFWAPSLVRLIMPKQRNIVISLAVAGSFIKLFSLGWMTEKTTFIGRNSWIFWICVRFLCLTSLSNHLGYGGCAGPFTFCHQPPPAPQCSNPWPKPNSHWLDWRRSNQIRNSYVIGFRVCAYTGNWQAQAKAPTLLNAHSLAHTHACSLMQEPPLPPTRTQSLSVWVHCGKSAFWRRILHHGVSQLARPRLPNRVTVVTAVEN